MRMDTREPAVAYCARINPVRSGSLVFVKVAIKWTFNTHHTSRS